jgi:molybdenum cofactor cytidylyltransferase
MTAIGAIILAAGEGSRMGQAKQLLKIDGQSLVRRAARAGLDAGCDPVVVVTGAYADLVAEELAGLPIHSTVNESWSDGIGSSVRAGLAAMQRVDPSAAGAVIAVCDQPNLNAAVIRNLLAAWSKSQKPMAACEYGGTVGPPCCFSRAKFDDLSRLPDGDGAKRLLRADPANVAAISWQAGADDLDTPDDLRRFCENNPGPTQSSL